MGHERVREPEQHDRQIGDRARRVREPLPASDDLDAERARPVDQDGQRAGDGLHEEQ